MNSKGSKLASHLHKSLHRLFTFNKVNIYYFSVYIVQQRGSISSSLRLLLIILKSRRQDKGYLEFQWNANTEIFMSISIFFAS